jgi:hypothetical protein
MAPREDAGGSSERTSLLGTTDESLPSHLTNGVLPSNDINHVVANDLERYRTRGSIDEARAAQFKRNEEVAKQLKFIIPAIAVGVFLAAADQSIIVSSFAKIGSDLQALNLTSWITTAYFSP